MKGVRLFVLFEYLSYKYKKKDETYKEIRKQKHLIGSVVVLLNLNRGIVFGMFQYRIQSICINDLK